MGYLLFKGIIIGFAIAAPVGPIGILTIDRSLRHGSLAGLATGMGAATADAFYGCVAGFSLTLVSGFLLAWKHWILGAGGIFLLYLGIPLLKKSRNTRDQTSSHGFTTYSRAYISALFLTLTNPMTIMAFMGIFAGLGLAAGTDGTFLSAALLVLGVFLGSCLWWLILSTGAGAFRQHLTPAVLGWVNRAAGLTLVGFGTWALVSLGLGI